MAGIDLGWEKNITTGNQTEQWTPNKNRWAVRSEWCRYLRRTHPFPKPPSEPSPLFTAVIRSPWATPRARLSENKPPHDRILLIRAAWVQVLPPYCRFSRRRFVPLCDESRILIRMDGKKNSRTYFRPEKNTILTFQLSRKSNNFKVDQIDIK